MMVSPFYDIMILRPYGMIDSDLFFSSKSFLLLCAMFAL
jgi:hypothetical protein